MSLWSRVRRRAAVDVAPVEPEGSSADGVGTEPVPVEGYDDVRAVLSDPLRFTSIGVVECGQRRPLLPLQASPEDHPRVRAALDAFFAPRRVAAFEQRLRDRADGLIDGFVADGAADASVAYARPFPVLALLELLELPETEAAVIRGFHDSILGPQRGAPGEPSVEEVGRRVDQYFTALVHERRGGRGDDLVRSLMRPAADVPPLSGEEVVDVCFLLVLAGIDPVANALSGAVAHLATIPSARAALVDDPRELRRTIDELLRFGSAVKALARRATEDVVVAGREVHRGEQVSCVLTAANRDPRVFDSPDDFDPSRAPRHLSFGAGPHHCVGAHLARLELRLALEQLHRRLPDHRLDAGAPAPDPATVGSADPVRIVFSPAAPLRYH